MQEFDGEILENKDKQNGSVYRFNGSVFITMRTSIWRPEIEGVGYLAMLVLLPIDNGNYSYTYFEPLNIRKVVKNYTVLQQPMTRPDYVQTGNFSFPTLYGTNSTGYEEIDSAQLRITYYDDNGYKRNDHPFKAGTLVFKIHNWEVDCSGDIQLIDKTIR